MTRYIAEAIKNYDGKKGDSSGLEVRTCEWWDYKSCGTVTYWVHPDKAVRNRMIHAAVEIAKNDSFGYSMNEARTTGYKAVKAVGWDWKRIKDIKEKVSLDCSEMMAVVVNCGLQKQAMPSSNWTGNEAENLKACGFSEVKDYTLGCIILAHKKLKGTGHTGIYIGTKKTGLYYDLTATRYRSSVTKDGKTWLLECRGDASYSGNGKAIRWFAVDAKSYKVRTAKDGWLPKVKDYNTAHLVTGCAGNGKPITGVQIEGKTYRAYFNGKWGAWIDGTKSWAGDGIHNITRIQVK